ATSRPPAVRATKLRHTPSNFYIISYFMEISTKNRKNFDTPLFRLLTINNNINGLLIAGVLPFSSAPLLFIGSLSSLPFYSSPKFFVYPTLIIYLFLTKSPQN
ncbi:MAG: hypothetical protein ACLTMW_09065, partial [Blautia hydrogenotrophica]